MTGYERKTERSKYWSIGSTGGVYTNYEYDDSTDNTLYDNANYHSDEILAKNNERADKLMRQLRRFAVEHNEEEIDWHNIYQNKYYIMYRRGTYENGYEYEFIIDFIEVGRDFGQIYFTSRAIAREAINTFRDELIWYFTEYCDHVVENKNENNVGCEICNNNNLLDKKIKSEAIKEFAEKFVKTLSEFDMSSVGLPDYDRGYKDCMTAIEDTIDNLVK